MLSIYICNEQNFNKLSYKPIYLLVANLRLNLTIKKQNGRNVYKNIGKTKKN